MKNIFNPTGGTQSSMTPAPWVVSSLITFFLCCLLTYKAVMAPDFFQKHRSPQAVNHREQKAARFASQFESNATLLADAMTDYHRSLLVPRPLGWCHNASGSCDAARQVFVCLNGADVVPFGDRCDGLEDCPDGSDELLCNVGPQPIIQWMAIGRSTRRSTSVERTFDELMTCSGCTCVIGGPIEVGQGNPWYDMALATKTVQHLQLEFPEGVGCDAHATATVMVQLYKKSGFCRKAVCCVRQEKCVSCRFKNVTATPGKCRVFVKNATHGAM